MSDPDDILKFWFGDLVDSPTCDPEVLHKQEMTKWFKKDPAVDKEITERFAGDVERAAKGELDAWAKTPRGRLALIVLLDQFSRNMHRDSPLAFANDEKALNLTQEGIAQGVEAEYHEGLKFVFYLPLMHSEDLAVQKLSVERWHNLRDTASSEKLKAGLGYPTKFAERHLEIVERFGRFPHRNKPLGRTSTPEEIQFLTEPNSSF